jgi:1,4-dihydroxy-2-naphthoate polyprenyltransferase
MSGLIFSKSNFLHLRIPFSVFLMPVFLFAISQISTIHIADSVLLFIVLHLLVYPASHAFNSHYDNDVGAIGGLGNPPAKNKSLLQLANILDSVAILFSLFINVYTTIAILLYISASRLYSYRPIRIKQYPLLSFMIVCTCQGALVYYIVCFANNMMVADVQIMFAAILSSILIASSYPITQVYQHVQDANDSVQTLSMLLGIKGTFIFAGILFAFVLTGFILYFNAYQLQQLIIPFAISLAPIGIYFTYWGTKVWQQKSFANYYYTIRFLILAAICSDISFFVIIFYKYFTR